MTVDKAAAAESADEEIERRSQAFGETIRRLRAERKLTVRALAANAGIAYSTVSKVENGLMSPTYDSILRLANGLGVELETLFGRTAEHVEGGGVAEAGKIESKS